VPLDEGGTHSLLDRLLDMQRLYSLFQDCWQESQNGMLNSGDEYARQASPRQTASRKLVSRSRRIQMIDIAFPISTLYANLNETWGQRNLQRAVLCASCCRSFAQSLEAFPPVVVEIG